MSTSLPTPRTDSLVYKAGLLTADREVVFADNCRRFEREAAILREALEAAFRHVCGEISRKPLNESARDGTQATSRLVAEALEAAKKVHEP